MEDTIMTHDRLIGARFSYWFSEPERGDIVIFHYPVDEKKIYIKRIIGLPGETVRLDDGLIYIDDSEEPLKEGYLKEKWEVLNSDFEFLQSFRQQFRFQYRLHLNLRSIQLR
jgi:signal peptidase I